MAKLPLGRSQTGRTDNTGPVWLLMLRSRYCWWCPSAVRNVQPTKGARVFRDHCGYSL